MKALFSTHEGESNRVTDKVLRFYLNGHEPKRGPVPCRGTVWPASAASPTKG